MATRRGGGRGKPASQNTEEEEASVYLVKTEGYGDGTYYRSVAGAMKDAERRISTKSTGVIVRRVFLSQSQVEALGIQVKP